MDKPQDLAGDRFPGLRIRLDGGTAWLEYHRPPINAFDWDMLRGTREALRILAESPAVRVVVIASALPRFFNSGADLRVFADITPHGMEEWVGICHDMVAIMRDSPKPMLACIEGTAVGGGLELALHCDVRFASSDARMGQPEVHIGFIPPIGATQALGRLLGRPAALRYLYDGELISAEAARGIGLIDVIVSPDAVRKTVSDYAEALARRPASALAAIRRCVTLGAAGTFESGLELERRTAVALAGHPDFREGVRAFLEKRTPRWNHAMQPEPKPE